MINKLIESELKKVEVADLSNFDADKNMYNIKKRVDIKLEKDKCYLIYLKSTFFNNDTVKSNWNNNSVPAYKYLKISVNNILGKMIKVDAIAFNYETKTDIQYFWSGWISTYDIDILLKL